MIKRRTFYLPEACKANKDTKVPIISLEHIGPKPTYYFAASLLWIWDPQWEGHGAFQIWLRWKEGATENEEFITHTIANERIYLYRFEGYQNGFYIDFQKHGDAANKPRYNIRILYRQFRPGKVNFTMGVAHNGLKAVFEDE